MSACRDQTLNAKVAVQAEILVRKKTSLNFENDTMQLQKLVKQLHDEGIGCDSKIALYQDKSNVTGKQADDYFSNSFAKDSN